MLPSSRRRASAAGAGAGCLAVLLATLAAIAGCSSSHAVAGATPAVASAEKAKAESGPAATRPALPQIPPATEAGCRACNGTWGVHGLATAESCVCRTSDGGKRCRDGAECQGLCIAAEEPEREVVEAGPPARGFFVGRCSDLVTVFGCNRLIDRGATTHGPVVLAEPPVAICID